ncbi:hypothetical protein STCU_04340 [Strigomonas culicis]|uniref:RNA uridylyltransferase n=1 Tax=Strigomonas culicis TaxID=28005 RepID=S9UL72_9TRYP|nr:hypothetical protein STCU_04340 [Strigomonas culicis]|eukprot:EPY29683.1 hypothetical protein STCU_04340 [Strigomonas culicis]
MRRFLTCRKINCARFFTASWKSILPQPTDQRWDTLGNVIVQYAQSCDTGKQAFDECCVAREQLEFAIQSIGHDASIYIFGGLVTLGLFEVGGDVDFVGILDVEPDFEEAGIIIRRLSKELRRIGFRSSALPRARVPVVKVDRLSKALPGTPLHNLAKDGVFQFIRALDQNEAIEFETRLRENFDAVEVEWNNSHQVATITFNSTSSLMYALTHMKYHDNVEIPIRIPVDVRHGPELFRFPFDVCLSSTGLRNSYLFRRALLTYPYSRHLLLAIKKWGRSSGIINSIDGLLASYALTVMMIHFLALVGKIPPLNSLCNTEEIQTLDIIPQYLPLPGLEENKSKEVGYLFALFLEYYGSVFNYKDSVVCTSNMDLQKTTMNWDKGPNVTMRPPFFEFCIKDPYGLDNVARNLNHDATLYVQDSHQLALQALLKDFNDPLFAFSNLIQYPPKPRRVTQSLAERGIHSDVLPTDQLEARHVLKKMQFHDRKTVHGEFWSANHDE